MKLTILINTYNRPQEIQRQVRDVLKQLTDDVCLIVRDNKSDQPIDSLFTEEELSKFTIYTNDVNIGAEANLVRGLEGVSSGWAWTLGDDDIIKDNAVTTILQIISEHPNCCFINTDNKKNGIYNSLEEFLSFFKIVGVFGKTFFQSACLFNMDQLNGSVRWFYDFLSSQIGQLCMVIKHMENNPGASCYITKTEIIAEHTPGGWSKMNFLMNTTLVVNRFRYLKPIMKNTLFSSIAKVHLDIISGAKLSFCERFHYIIFLIKTFGFINLLCYNSTSIIAYLMNRILPRNFYDSIHSLLAKRYNKNIK